MSKSANLLQDSLNLLHGWRSGKPSSFTMIRRTVSQSNATGSDVAGSANTGATSSGLRLGLLWNHNLSPIDYVIIFHSKFHTNAHGSSRECKSPEVDCGNFQLVTYPSQQDANANCCSWWRKEGSNPQLMLVKQLRLTLISLPVAHASTVGKERPQICRNPLTWTHIGAHTRSDLQYQHQHRRDLLTAPCYVNDTFNLHRPFPLEGSVVTQSLQIDCKIANNHD